MAHFNLWKLSRNIILPLVEKAVSWLAESSPEEEETVNENIEELLNTLDEDFSKKFNSQAETTNSYLVKQINFENNSYYYWSNICSDLSREALKSGIQQIIHHAIGNLATNCNKVSPQNYQIGITYTEYEVRLKKSHPLLNETMETRSDPRPPFAFVMGNRVMIELKSTISTRTSQVKLNKLANYLENKKGNVENLDISGIVYSVKGDIPLTYTVNEFCLTQKNLQSLAEFTTTKFYQSNIAKRELLEISTKPINLKKYFRPLFEKLVEIKKLAQDRHRGYFKSAIDLVVKEVLLRVELAASAIAQGVNYLDHLKYLQNVYTSFLLNRQELSNYMDELVDLMSEDKIHAEIVRRCDYRRRFEDDWEVTILFNLIPISVINVLQTLENDLKLCFDNEEFHLDQHLLTKNFSDEINRELSCINKNVDEKMKALRSYEDFMKKNIDVEFSVNISIETVNASVLVCPIKKQIEMVPACPILIRPKNIRMIDSTESTITIEWDFQDDRLVISYKVHYRCVSDGHSGPLHYINCENKVLIVSNIAPGKYYAFRIQARFKDIVGAPSLESQPFSTKSVTIPSDDLMCPICEDERKGFAFVPCGHTIGGKCARRLQECPFCYARIERKLKIYN